MLREFMYDVRVCFACVRRTCVLCLCICAGGELAYVCAWVLIWAYVRVHTCGECIRKRVSAYAHTCVHVYELIHLVL